MNRDRPAGSELDVVVLPTGSGHGPAPVRSDLQPVGRFRQPAVALEAGLARLQEHFVFECEQRRTFPWLPVVFGAGILLYFRLPREPFAPAFACFAVAAFVIAFTSCRANRPFRIWLALGLIALGAFTAQVRTMALSGSTISHPFFADVQGTVEGVQVRSGRPARITIADLDIERSKTGEVPGRIRISLLKRDRLPAVGTRIEVRARLSPVPGPVIPGGYDPRRAAFFQGIGGSGFAVGTWTPLPPAGDRGYSRLAGDRIAGLRQAITDRIRAADGDRSGAVAAALLVGERGYLPDDLVDNLRNAGLAHILAISGLHMALFSGTVFFLLRAAFALSPYLALTWPIKKWAAVIAIIAGFGYLMISGGNVPTYWAFIMAAIMFGAVLVDRPAISLRNLAIAALIILAFEPESILEPGFQMSFAAVMALVAFYEWWRRRERKSLAEPPAGPAGRMLRSLRVYIGTIVMTTVVAGFATAPIAGFHFNHVALYSVVANLAAMPILAFVVMPAGLLSLAMMPFGLEAVPLAAMGVGTNWIIDVAAHVGGSEASHRTVPAMPWPAFAVLMGGMVWLCLWQGGWRWIGLAMAGIALPLSLAGQVDFDVLVNPSGKMVAVRDGAGTLSISAKQVNQYVLEQWSEIDGVSPQEASGTQNGVLCDDTACILDTGSDFRVAHIRDYSAFSEDCRHDAIVVTPLRAPETCDAALVVDQAVLEGGGAHAITIRGAQAGNAGGEPVFEISTAFPAIRRPWHGKAPGR